MEEHDFGLGTVIFDPKNDLEFLTIGNTKKVWWICEKRGHRFESSYKQLEKSKGCPVCASNILKDYSKLPHKEMIEDITKNWETNYQRSQKKADAQMYSSLLNPKNRKLIETVIDKYDTFKNLRYDLFDDPIPLEEDIYEKKLDLSNSAFKRYARTLNYRNNNIDWTQRNEDILAEIKFLGAFAFF